MGILRDAHSFSAMKIRIIVTAICLVLLCQLTTFAQSSQSNQPASVGLHASATVIQGTHISGIIREILLSDTYPRAAAYEVELSGFSNADLNLLTTGDLKPHRCRVSAEIAPLPLKQVRFCGTYTVFTSAVIQIIQEVL